MTLKEQGFRFVLRGLSFIWVHPSLVEPGDMDVTDYTDKEFETLVRSVAP